VEKPFEPEALRARVNELLSTLRRHVA